MCGRSAERHGVVLIAVHKVRLKTAPENRDLICEECNAGMEPCFWHPDPEWMDAAMAHESVHVRLGEALKAFKGEAVPASTLEFVANQDDWKKRIRELRYLGWKVETFNRKLSEGGRVSSYYRVTKSLPWPQDPTGIIRRYERERAERNKVDE
jgi:hypothetical protein